MTLVMVTKKALEPYEIRKIMVRLPELDAAKLEEEATRKGKKLATYCKDILSDYLTVRTKGEELRPAIKNGVREILLSDDLDDEFGKKVAKVISKRYE